MSAVNLEDTNLEWQTFKGSIPVGAVSIYNDRKKRIDYVAKFGIEAGFYNRDMGPSCHYAYADKELQGSPFQILVNKDNFECLEWKWGSYGSVPENSVYTNPNDIYVGKNEYGLGKVNVKHEAFFLPWEGKEYWYKDYEVLTFSPDVISEHLSDVKYKTDDVNIIKYPPEILTKSVLTNNSDHEVKQTATLSKTTQVEQRWDTSFSMATGVTTSITAGIPEIAEVNIQVSVETTFQLSQGTTHTESTNHSVSVEVNIPPKHYCSVSMVAYKYGADIPYTVRLKRRYRNGETRWTSITGTYKGVTVGEIRSVVDPWCHCGRDPVCGGSLSTSVDPVPERILEEAPPCWRSN